MEIELIDLRPGGKYGAVPDPTPEEIRQRCAEIQREWSPEEEYRRRAHRPETGWRVPEVRGGE